MELFWITIDLAYYAINLFLFQKLKKKLSVRAFLTSFMSFETHKRLT